MIIYLTALLLSGPIAIGIVSLACTLVMLFSIVEVAFSFNLTFIDHLSNFSFQHTGLADVPEVRVTSAW